MPRGRRGGEAGRGRGGATPLPPGEEQPSRFADPLDEIKDNLGAGVELVESAVVVPIAEDFCYYDRYYNWMDSELKKHQGGRNSMCLTLHLVHLRILQVIRNCNTSFDPLI